MSRSTVMPKIKVKGQTVQTEERPQSNGHTHTHTSLTLLFTLHTRTRTNGRTHKHTHGRYQTYYLPCYAVDNHEHRRFATIATHAKFTIWGFSTHPQFCCTLLFHPKLHLDQYIDLLSHLRGENRRNTAIFTKFAISVFKCDAQK